MILSVQMLEEERRERGLGIDYRPPEMLMIHKPDDRLSIILRICIYICCICICILFAVFFTNTNVSVNLVLMMHKGQLLLVHTAYLSLNPHECTHFVNLFPVNNFQDITVRKVTALATMLMIHKRCLFHLRHHN